MESEAASPVSEEPAMAWEQGIRMRLNFQFLVAAISLGLLAGCVTTYPYASSFSLCDNRAGACYRDCEYLASDAGYGACHAACEAEANQCFNSAYSPYSYGGPSYAYGYGSPWYGSYGSWYPQSGYSFSLSVVNRYGYSGRNRYDRRYYDNDRRHRNRDKDRWRNDERRGSDGRKGDGRRGDGQRDGDRDGNRNRNWGSQPNNGQPPYAGSGRPRDPSATPDRQRPSSGGSPRRPPRAAPSQPSGGRSTPPPARPSSPPPPSATPPASQPSSPPPRSGGRGRGGPPEWKKPDGDSSGPRERNR